MKPNHKPSSSDSRRSFFQKAAGAAVLLATSLSLRAGKVRFDKAPGIPGKFMHVVFFWLVDDRQETHEKFLKELNGFIDQVDVITSQHIGSPADTDREVIDNTYSYSLILSFESKKEHDIYQAHQAHKDFIANASDLWEKVLVYDSELL